MSEENLTTAAPPPRRVRWEYQQLVLAPDAPTLGEPPLVAGALREAGAEGWELVAVVPTTRGGQPALLYAFKRPAD